MDWITVLADLKAAGVSQKEIADVAGCSQPTICDLANGNSKDTKMAIGTAILKLHRERCAPASTSQQAA